MHGPLRVALALLLVVASTAAAAPFAVQSDAEGTSTADGLPPVVAAANTSAHLALPDDRIETVRFGTVTLDVGGSLAMDNARVHGRYATTRLREAFAAADDDDAQRRAVVLQSTARLEGRIENLTARERDALEAYNAGDLSTRAYLRELAAIHVTADALLTTIDQLYTFNRAAGTPVEATRVARMKARLAPLTGPVRGRLAAAMEGDSDAVRVYVETSESGFVLSMIETGQYDTQYTREAYFGDGLDNRWADKPLSIDEFEQRLEELYPWVTANKDSSDSALTSEPNYIRSGVYAIAFNHPHGTISNRDLTVYYDAGTQSVFYEIQRLDVDQVPTEQVANVTDENLRIRVRATYSDGPMVVNVTDATTGEPVDATVEVNGQTVGTTARGDVWTVAPRGEFTVTASSGGRNVTAVPPNLS
jgi:hypothetical protein